MDREKRKRLEAAGWAFGDAGDFLELSDQEQRYIDLRLALGQLIREARVESGLSQKVLILPSPTPQTHSKKPAEAPQTPGAYKPNSPP